MPTWAGEEGDEERTRTVAYINPLVSLETVEYIDNVVLRGNLSKNKKGRRAMSIKEVRRFLVSKRYTTCKDNWTRINKERKKMTDIIRDLLEKSDNILCPEFPKDKSGFDLLEQVADDIKRFSYEDISPADVFHYHFMRDRDIRVAITADRDFTLFPIAAVHSA